MNENQLRAATMLVNNYRHAAEALATANDNLNKSDLETPEGMALHTASLVAYAAEEAYGAALSCFDISLGGHGRSVAARVEDRKDDDQSVATDWVSGNLLEV